MQGKIRVAVIPTVIATYRRGFYDKLVNSQYLDVTIFCQSSVSGTKIKCISSEYPSNVKYVKFLSTRSGSFTWQFLPFINIVRNFDVVIISGNPRVVSDFFLGICLLLIRKPVVLWTMAKSFRANKVTQFLRLTWSKNFKFILTYNEDEILFLREFGFKKNVLIGLNNGLDQKLIDFIVKKWNKESLNNWLCSKNLNNKKIILSVARLESKNNFELVLSSLPYLLKTIPNIHWIVIGDGSQANYLKGLCSKYNLDNHVSFCGSIFIEDELAPYFLSASLFVHPAAIGLSLLHAFGYGLPVITHGVSQFHGPEYVAFCDGKTGLNFEYNNCHSLVDVINNLISDENKRLFIKNYNLDLVRKVYNVDIMFDRFFEMINLVLKSFKK